MYNNLIVYQEAGGFIVTLAVALENPVFLIFAVVLLGLVVGSFLNVVIYRLPVMMERTWRKECSEYLELPAAQEKQEPFNLAIPGSRCGHCNAAIKALHNIPVVSYLWLRGKCAYCNNRISARYPLVEAFTAVVSAVVAWRFGFTPETIFALLLTWSLISLSLIDFDHQLLPDSITLPILWLGLFLSLFGLFTDTQSSIIGAISGYLSLWSVYQVFKLLTGKEGMGYGDFKLLGLFGAWLGWQILPLIVLLSSLVGAIVGITLMLVFKHERNKPIPFGPYLAVAGWIALLWGEEINRWYLLSLG